jgi:hypothetical protein
MGPKAHRAWLHYEFRQGHCMGNHCHTSCNGDRTGCSQQLNFFYVVFFLQSNSSIAASFGGVEQAFMPAVELAKFSALAAEVKTCRIYQFQKLL